VFETNPIPENIMNQNKSRRTAVGRLLGFFIGTTLTFLFGKSSAAAETDVVNNGLPSEKLKSMILKTYTRIVTSDLEATLKPLKALVGRDPDIRIPLPFSGVELVALGDFFIIAGNEKALKPFRSVLGPVIVADLAATRAELLRSGAKINGPDVKVSTGRFLVSSHPNGVEIEWLEWRTEIWQKVKAAAMA
jgi:hypothetical protein